MGTMKTNQGAQFEISIDGVARTYRDIVLACIAEHPAHLIDQLLPWNWRPVSVPAKAA